MMLGALFTAGAALGAQVTPAPLASDIRAEQAFQFFSSFCVTSNGNRDRAVATLGDGNALANRLPTQTTDALLGGTGTIGWAVRSPSNALLMLAYSGESHCEVRVQAADETTLITQFDALATAFSASPSDAAKPQAKSENGVVRTFRAFRFKVGLSMATVAMTTSAKPVGEMQHFITFDLTNKN